MRAQIMNSLRKAGDKVQAFDDAYAAKLAEYIGAISTKQGSIGDNLQNAVLMVSGVPATRRFDTGDVANTMSSAQILHNLVGYGVPAVNAGVRYGIPAAGAVGLAGMLNSGYQQLSQVDVTGQPIEDPNLMIRQTPYVSM